MGIPGESMACLPSATTSFTSSAFFLRPRVPTFVQKVSSPDVGSYRERIYSSSEKTDYMYRQGSNLRWNYMYTSYYTQYVL